MASIILDSYCMGDDDSIFEAVKRKGSMQIVYVIGADGVVRFKDLKSHVPVSEPTIANRLDELVERGLVERTVHDELPHRVDYSLTPTGEQLHEYLVDLFDWAADRAVTSHQTTYSEYHEEDQRPTCVYCEPVADADTEGEGSEVPWYRTVDGLIELVAKTYVMPAVVHLASEDEPIRYGKLDEKLNVTSDAAMVDRLSNLGDAGLLTRRSYDEVPPHVEYSLTEHGRDLAKCLEPLLAWATKKQTTPSTCEEMPSNDL